MISEIRTTSDRRRTASLALLFFAAVAVAMLFLGSGKAYANGHSQDDSDTSGGSQSATGTNRGDAAATSGSNNVAGNKVGNETKADEPTDNRQTVKNEATGRATVSTGSAAATGNTASSSITQKASDPSGSNGSAINQSANISNVGNAVANSGNNRVAGNAVTNTLSVDQDSRRGDDNDAAENDQDVDNDLRGLASLSTGDANSTGNTAWNGVSQIASAASANGAGSAAINQTANVSSHGTATANTGENHVAGNHVENDLDAVQEVRNHGPPRDHHHRRDGRGRGDEVGGQGHKPSHPCRPNHPNPKHRCPRDRDGRDGRFGDVAVENDQEVDNDLRGRASLVTGNATAYGNSSQNNVSQEACANCEHGDVTVNQSATVVNDGNAVANTGRNRVAGNHVVNNLDVDQEVNDRDRDRDGDRDRRRRRGGGGQGDEVSGEGHKPSHPCRPNHPNPKHRCDRDGRDGRDGRGDAPVDNDQDVDNDLNGRADAVTGDATATGSNSSTSVSQKVCAKGHGTVGQAVNVSNTGTANANSGDNEVAGNAVDNNLSAEQTVGRGGDRDRDRDHDRGRRGRGGQGDEVSGEGHKPSHPCRPNHPNPKHRCDRDGRDGRDGRGDFLLDNDQDVDNDLNGRADLVTGSASATANWSSTDIAQAANLHGEFTVDAPITVTNAGTADATSGDNDVAGNAVDNDLDVDQEVRDDRNRRRHRHDGRDRRGGGGGDSVGGASHLERAVCREGSNRFDEERCRELRRLLHGRDGRDDDDNDERIRNRQDVDNELRGRASLATGNVESTGNVSTLSIRQEFGPDAAECDCFAKKAHKAEKAEKHAARERAARGGGELAFTGAPLAGLTILGLILIAVGGVIRRRSQVTA